MEQNSKNMTPKELGELYVCKGDKDHPPCPIFKWCMDHVFQPDTCEVSWAEYLKAHETNGN